MSDNAEVFDFVIVGAGISGINCAYRLQTQLPHAKFTVLECRDEIGGTWSQFTYPGARSDTTMFTLGFEWHSWSSMRPIAGSPEIMEYLHDAVSKYRLGRYVRFRHKVLSAKWSSEEQLWDLTVDHGGRQYHFTTHWLVLSTGYYDYQTPLQADIPDLENYKGKWRLVNMTNTKP
ncbi:hypothetical protein DL771_002821 [Monosporascus sp. 5C6A]|nr:hypothetical protein DL771_002821 [Monosporascus sp. 5C6A]